MPSAQCSPSVKALVPCTLSVRQSSGSLAAGVGRRLDYAARLRGPRVSAARGRDPLSAGAFSAVEGAAHLRPSPHADPARQAAVADADWPSSSPTPGQHRRHPEPPRRHPGRDEVARRPARRARACTSSAPTTIGRPVFKNPLRYFLPNGGKRKFHGPPLPWRDLKAAFDDVGWIDLGQPLGSTDRRVDVRSPSPVSTTRT